MTRRLSFVAVAALAVSAGAATELSDVAAVGRPGTRWVEISYAWPLERLSRVAPGDSAWIAVEASRDGGES